MISRTSAEGVFKAGVTRISFLSFEAIADGSCFQNHRQLLITLRSFEVTRIH